METTLYFTKLLLSPQTRRQAHAGHLHYQLHDEINRAFYGHARQENRVLWRLEQATPHQVLVQSEHQPNWTHVLGGRGLLMFPEVKPVVVKLKKGRAFRFLLDGNPSMRNRWGERPATLGMETDSARLAWLRRKFSDGGFELLEAEELGWERLQIVKRLADEQQRITLLRARFYGVVRVAQETSALATLCGGIGRGKAFGLGLLSLTPR